MCRAEYPTLSGKSWTGTGYNRPPTPGIHPPEYITPTKATPKSKMPINIPVNPDGGLSVLHLILGASWLVQAVMLILLLASVISWFMIDRKRSSY